MIYILLQTPEFYYALAEVCFFNKIENFFPEMYLKDFIKS